MVRSAVRMSLINFNRIDLDTIDYIDDVRSLVE